METDDEDIVVEVEVLDSFAALPLFDVRSRSAFEASHADGAVRLPVETWRAAAAVPRTSLANVAFWEKAIGEIGICEGRLVLLYDDGRMTDAAHAWFVLQHFGALPYVSNGGEPRLREARPTLFAASPGRLPAPVPMRAIQEGGEIRLVDHDRAQAAPGAPVHALLVHAAPGRTNGQASVARLGAGVLRPVSISLEALLDERGRIRSAPELRPCFRALHIASGDRVVICSDDGGVAALAALAAWRAGLVDVGVCSHGFSGWLDDALQ